jgi:hypothetical protein
VKRMASGLLVPEAHCGKGYFGRRVSDEALDRAADLRIREGLTTAEIGARTGLAPATVSYHLGSIIQAYPTMYERRRRKAAEQRWVCLRAEDARRQRERERVRELRLYGRRVARRADERAAAAWRRARLAARRSVNWHRLPLEERAEWRWAERTFEVKEQRWALDEWERALAEARDALRLQRRGQRAYVAAERLSDRLWRPATPTLVSLDAPSKYGVAWHELFLPAPNSDPFEQVVGNEVDEVLGDLALEDIGRLSEDELRRLQESLRAIGVGPRSVQGRERDRLRVVEPRRGSGAPARNRSAMSTKHKHRKPGHRKSAGSKRGSRKPQKRWSREAA